MARLLVQLKLRLLRNALRASTGAQAVHRQHDRRVPGRGGDLRRAGRAAGQQRLGGPDHGHLHLVRARVADRAEVAFGLDSTLDPATLALYPLRTRPLVTGLLAASATGAWPVANVLGLLGVTVGLARGGLGVLFAFIAVALQVLFCIVLARFVITGMARMLRSRRGKDLAVFLIVPVGAILEFLIQVVPRAAASGGLSPASFAGVDSWLRWLPPGLAAHAIQDASTGHLGDAAARLGLLVAVSSSCLACCGCARSPGPWSPRTPPPGHRACASAALPLARYGLRGAVAARFLRYQRRDPASLAYWAIAVVVMFICSASTIVGPQKHPGVVIASAIFGAAFVGVYHANPVGQAGPAFVLEAHGAARAPGAARLLLRSGHCVRRDRDTAPHRYLNRSRSSGRRSDGGGRRCRGGPGRAGRGPGDRKHLHRRTGLSHRRSEPAIRCRSRLRDTPCTRSPGLRHPRGRRRGRHSGDRPRRT